MSTHLGMLVAYDIDGNIIATLGHMVMNDETTGSALGLIDFGAHEEAGGEHTDIWIVRIAKGSKVWPEWLGARAHDFRVELAGPSGARHIAALVHKTSGHRRERAAIEAAIAARIEAAAGQPADIRDLVGGPDRPLALDDQGRTKPRLPGTRPALPIVSRRRT